MKTIAVAISLLCGLLVGCVQGKSKVSSPEFHKLVGQQVTLVGVAQPRKIGAALRGENFYVWIDGLHDWTEQFSGRRVQVTGILEERHDLPVFVQKPGELPVQGMPVPEGTDLHAASQRYVIRDATWRLTR